MNTQCNHCTLLSPHHQHWRPPRNAAKTSHPLQPLAFFSLPGGKPKTRPAHPILCYPHPRNPHPPYRSSSSHPPALTVLPRGRLSSRPPPALEPPARNVHSSSHPAPAEPVPAAFLLHPADPAALAALPPGRPPPSSGGALAGKPNAAKPPTPCSTASWPATVHPRNPPDAHPISW